MATPRNLTQFAFAAGIDESQQDEVLEPSAGFTRLENVRQDKRGAITKRLGFAEATSTLTSGRRIIPYGTRTLVHNGSGLAQYDDTMGIADAGDSPCRCAVEHIWVASPGAARPQVSDIHVVGDYLATCWSGVAGAVDPYEIQVSIQRLSTGATIEVPSYRYGGATSSVGLLSSYGTRLFLVIADGTGNDVWAQYIDLANATTIGAGWTTITGAALKTDLNANMRFAVQGLTDRIAVVYVNTSGGASHTTCFTLDTTGVIETTTTIGVAATNPTSVDVSGVQSDTLWVAWNEGTACYVLGLAPASLATVQAATAAVITASGVAVPALYVVETATTASGRLLVVEDSTIPARTFVRDFTTTAGTVTTTTPQTSVRAFYASGSPALYGGRVYVPGYYADSLQANRQQTVMLCDFDSPAEMAIAVANPMPYVSQTTYKKAKVATSGTALLFAMGVRRSAAADATLVAKCDLAATNRALPAISDNGLLHLTGGVTMVHDGVAPFEVGFLVSPEKPTTTTSGTGITAATGWTYLAIWERQLANGDWVVSGISPASASTGAVANKTVNVALYPLTVAGTSDVYNVRARIYRTADGNEPPYYWVGTVNNDPTVDTITYADSVPDATLVTRSMLYAPNNVGGAGAPLDRRAPPCFQAITNYGGMIVGASGSVLWHSGDLVPGEGTWFSPVFQLPFPETIVALAAQDGTLFVFTRSAIYAVAGEYPSANGAAGGLGSPRKLAVDVGCIDARSVVVTALGIFFQSSRGIELLSRAQSVEWIGEAVQTTLASYPIITAATLDQANAVVRIECAASETSNAVSDTGVGLVYDLTLRSWVSVDKVYAEATASRSAQSAGMAYLGGTWRYVRLDKNGGVHYERAASDGSAHLDGSTWVTMLAETSWLKLGGIQGSQFVNRLQWLARKSTRADYSLSLAYDYATSYKTAATWAANAIDTLSTAIGRVQLEHPLHDEAEGVSVRALLQDATPTGGTVSTGKGATWIALTFEGTAREGATDLPDTAR